MYKIQSFEMDYLLFDELGFISKENFIGECLSYIAEAEAVNIVGCISESHALAVLREKGVQIDLLEEDGSEMSW